MSRKLRQVWRTPEPAAGETIARYRLALVREAVEPFTPPLPDWRDLDATAAFLQQLVSDRPFEVVGALLLDTNHRAIGYVLPYAGTLTRAAVEPRALFAAALLSNARYLLLFHGHPAGDPLFATLGYPQAYTRQRTQLNRKTR